jgi:carboxypeptidase Taq
MRDIYLLGSCGGVLAWDERVNMPRSGSKLRSDQMGLLSGMIHEQFTSPRIGELLSAVEQSDLVKNSDSIEAANVRELRQQYDKQTKLPKSLVEEITKTTTLSQTDWMTARKNNDFTLFEPWLDKIFG